MKYTKETLKRWAVGQTLFAPTSLQQAVNKLKFIQIDPIRSPATAQDLILRPRVTNYRVGDIERAYIDLELEEDFLVAHGYMTQDIWQLLHPRTTVDLTPFDKEVLEKVRNLEEIHPRDMVRLFERKREVNWWGGYSQASKMALERLHYYGFLRVVRRESGKRIYKAFIPPTAMLSPEERLRRLVTSIADISAPVTEKTLHDSMHRLRRHFGDTREVIRDLIKTGELERQIIDGVAYILPAEKKFASEVREGVTFLAPFDPVVRDRVRFEHLWGWEYRFEAYTPAAKRVRGYYAMPLLWQSEIIGWVNITVEKKELSVVPGFIRKKPSSNEFTQAFAKESSQYENISKPRG